MIWEQLCLTSFDFLSKQEIGVSQSGNLQGTDPKFVPKFSTANEERTFQLFSRYTFTFPHFHLLNFLLLCARPFLSLFRWLRKSLKMGLSSSEFTFTEIFEKCLFIQETINAVKLFWRKNFCCTIELPIYYSVFYQTDISVVRDM